jgi:hypothetical protein
MKHFDKNYEHYDSLMNTKFILTLNPIYCLYDHNNDQKWKTNNPKIYKNKLVNTFNLRLKDILNKVSKTARKTIDRYFDIINIDYNMDTNKLTMELKIVESMFNLYDVKNMDDKGEIYDDIIKFLFNWYTVDAVDTWLGGDLKIYESEDEYISMDFNPLKVDIDVTFTLRILTKKYGGLNIKI